MSTPYDQRPKYRPAEPSPEQVAAVEQALQQLSEQASSPSAASDDEA